VASSAKISALDPLEV